MNVLHKKKLHIRCLYVLLLTSAYTIYPAAGLTAETEPTRQAIRGRQVMVEKLQTETVPVKTVAEIVVEIEAELLADPQDDEDLQRKWGEALYLAAEKMRRDHRLEDAALLARECERVYEKAIDQNLEKGELPLADDLCALGRLYEFTLKDFKGAARFYREALAVDPEYLPAKIRYQRIWAYEK